MAQCGANLKFFGKLRDKLVFCHLTCLVSMVSLSHVEAGQGRDKVGQTRDNFDRFKARTSTGSTPKKQKSSAGDHGMIGNKDELPMAIKAGMRPDL